MLPRAAFLKTSTIVAGATPALMPPVQHAAMGRGKKEAGVRPPGGGAGGESGRLGGAAGGGRGAAGRRWAPTRLGPARKGGPAMGLPMLPTPMNPTFTGLPRG